MIYKQDFKQLFQYGSVHSLEKCLIDAYRTLERDLRDCFINGFTHYQNTWHDKDYVFQQDDPTETIKDFEIVYIDMWFTDDLSPGRLISSCLNMVVYFARKSNVANEIATLLEKNETLSTENIRMKTRLRELEERYSYQGEH